LANINSVITYNANLSPAQAQIKALTGQIASLNAAFNALDKSALKAQAALASTFAANVGQIGGFTTQVVKVNTAVENFGKSIQSQRLTMRQYFSEALAGYTKQNSLMKQLAAQQVAYQKSIALPMGAGPGGVGRAMIMTPTAMNAMANATELASAKFNIFNELITGGSTKLLNFGKNTQWAGRQLMVGFTIPLAMFTAAVSKQFRDLDKELTRFQKVYGQDLLSTTKQSTAAMRKQVEQLAFDIGKNYGIAAKDTAALAADIAATGAEGEKLIKSVKETTRLAVLGEVDRQEAMKATLALQSAFKMNTDELTQSINFLNAVENQTSTTLQDFATAIPRVGPVVQSLGGDIQDLAMMLVAMREGGVPAAEAANAIKSGLASMINPTQKASDVAKQFGINLNKIVEDNRGQLMPTIYAMQNALQGLDDFGRARVIEEIFGKYQFARMSALFDNLGKMGSQTQNVLELTAKSSVELAGIANAELKTLQESTAMKFQRSLEQLRNTLIPIGETLTETLIPIFDFIGKAAGKFIEFFQSLPEPVKNFSKYITAIAALAGPIIMMVGLFGNLIANGIRFGMMVVRLGARIAGLKVEKFELLNAETAAARLGIENLTQSFTTQEVALRKLITAMAAYGSSLRTLQTTNPALFVPGAGRPPIRRATGSSRPEFVPGSGRGDKIPAMLEPGEFVVNRKATQKYAPVLMQMNRGTLQGFQQGTQLSHLYRAKDQNVGSLLQLPFLDQGARAMLMLIQSIHGADFQVKTYSNAVVGLSTTLNQSMERGQASIEMFRREISDTGAAFDPLKEQLRVMIAETGEFNGDLNLAEQAVGSFAQQMRAQAAGFKGSTFNADQLQAMSMAALAGVSDPRQRAALMKLFETPTAFSAGRGLTASNMYTFGQASGVPMYSGGEGKSKRIYAQLGPEEYLGIRPRGERIPLGNMPTYQGAQISPLSFALPVGAKSLSQPYSTPTMYTPEGQRVTKSMASSMGSTQRELFIKQIETSAATFIDDLARAFVNTVAKTLEAASPSKRADREMAVQGKNFGDGASQGFIKGYKSSAAGKPIIAGPVGGTGIESISNAQKISQADQSILKLKDMQLKHTADRVRAEVELLALQKAYSRGEINIVQFKEQERKLASDQKIAAERELRIQNIINEKKQRIAEADSAQLRSEQEEARNAARRATASMVAPGGIYGPGGYNVFGTVGRTSTTPGPKVPPSTVVTGPGKTIKNSQAQAGMRGVGTMNAMFMVSMAASSLSMLGVTSADASAKLGLFTTALMTATMAAQMFAGKNVVGNFMGMRSLGGKLGSTSSARLAASPALAQRAASIASAGGLAGGRMAGQGAAAAAASGGGRLGATLLGASRVLSIAGGPIGIAAGLGITAAITGFMLYKKAAEEARARAVAAFADPAATAEYFGKSVTSVTQQFKDMAVSAADAGLNAQEIDQGLREAVKQDYAPLIESLQMSGAEVGARELSNAFSKMIASGMSAEEATASVKAIALEAGTRGGEAFAQAMGQGMLNAINSLDAMAAFRATAASGETSQAAIASIQERTAATYQRARTFKPTGRGQIAFGQSDILRNAREIKDLTTTSSDELIKSAEFYYQTFTEAPKEAAKYFDEIAAATDESFNVDAVEEYLKGIDKVSGERLASMIDENADKAKQVLKALSVGMSIPEIIAAIEAGTLDAEINIRIDTQDAMNKLEDLKASLAETLGQDLQTKIESSDKSIQKFDKQIGRVQTSLDKGTETMQKNFEASQEASDAAIEGMQEEIDLIQNKIDKRREETQEKIDSLNKEKDQIQESTDAYIKSIQSRQKIDNFYANQRKSAFGALQKLASGDVFGFLQERTAMGQAAQQFAYDQQIQNIEDRRDQEIEAIEDVIEKEQERQDQYEKLHQDKIDAINDQIDAERKLQEEQRKGFEKELEDFQKKKEKRIEDLQDAKEKEQLKREKLQDIMDKANNQQIVSAKDLTKVLGPELAKPYIEEQKSIIRSTYLLELRKKDATQQSALDVIRPLLQTMYSGPDRVQGGGMQFDNASILEFLGLTARAGGGYITGPGGPRSDIVPAMLSNGEYVIQASSVNKYGKGMMDSINAGKYAEGGLIEGGLTTAQRSAFNYAEPNFVNSRMFPSKGKKPRPEEPAGSPPGGVTSNPTPVPGISNVMSLANKYSYLPYSSSYPIPTDAMGNPTGWGCATSVAWLYKNGAGITLPSPSLSYGQYSGLRQTVSKENIAPGDLIFYYNRNGVNTQNPVNHVEMYMGSGRVFNGGVGIQGGFSNHPVVAIKRPNKFAMGGLVSGPGGSLSDSVPAMLSRGEYVVRASSVGKYGKNMLDRINSGNFNVGNISSAQKDSPTFSMPTMSTNTSNINNIGGNSTNNVRIVINGASGKSAAAIANKVASMINSSNSRRNHSRSI
jgi:TP901 family phage tail tape measure protein